MSWIVVDVESNGPCPGLYSMISFGAVLLDEKLETTFYGQTLPVHVAYDENAYKVVGLTWEEHCKEPHEDPELVMHEFLVWLNQHCETRPIMVSDNPAFDFQWINYYFHYYLSENPFGHSARRIGDLYCGMKMDIRKNSEWKRKLRITKHTHNPVDDARGNAEALLAMREMGLNIKVD